MTSTLSSAPVASKSQRFRGLAREPTLSDQIAQSLVDAVRAGELAPGDRLPSERELSEEFDVSRNVIREAVRSLIGKGIVAAEGRRGLVVSRLGSDNVTESLSLYLSGNSSVTFEHVHDVRTGLEVQLAGVAAARLTEEQVADLREISGILHKAKSRQEAARADVHFHRARAQATGNELFVMMLDSVVESLIEVREMGFKTNGTVDYAATSHEEILSRIQEGDVLGARAAMREHLAEAGERLKAASEAEQRKRRRAVEDER